MRRRTKLALGAVGVVSLMTGYAVLDAYDLVPGILTVAPPPTPTPAPVPTAKGTSLALPSLATSGMPFRPAGAEGRLPSPAGVAAALAPVLADPGLAGGSGVAVRDAVTGTHLLDIASDVPRIPASTTKLLSAAGILASVSPATTLATTVVDGPTPDRITLLAGGDTLLNPGAGQPDSIAGHAGLADLAEQVAIQLKVAGRTAVVLGVDRSYAPGPRSAPTWPGDYIATGISGHIDVLGLSTSRSTPERPMTADPVIEVASALSARLGERGIAVTLDVAGGALPPSAATGVPPDGPPTTSPTTRPPSATPIATLTATPGRVLGSVQSAALVDQLALALIDSDNALTESLARQAAFRAGRATDFASTAAYLLEQVRGLGVDVTGAVTVDASGLSRANTLPPRLLADVLMLAASGRSPGLGSAVERLAVGGLSGTLTDRFTEPATSAGAGIVRAKTGTLTGVSALAGTVVTADGRPLVFVVLAPSPRGTPAARAALDRFGATLASCGCA
ncbi:MAG: D-alanyl-D-alanine carboxypeptidase [Actinomycetales bacterium]|nr:D-alanyl-D-alanine carboxypeptidase [Actinomycetales bacterium]